jgi:hypothetical protein
MKIRRGFVSNSSSSSFICDVCNSVESGMDLCLSDIDWVECENGHTFCSGHLLEKDEIEKEENDEDEDEDDEYIKFDRCPICQLAALKQEDALNYLLKQSDLTLKQLTIQVKEKFKTYEGLQKGLK